ncbi:MAG: LacI family DNA-binding transcriptional regulator [Miniphocaeibacter sp.]|uniref:LacI family DNA-binding transcriptional regulator n=1 Tax=Miniphocaeibacter sp. TaxID=3100973 RepID=UPI0017BE20D3|nr:LacI family transcriptional regulator [Gallicola sp.]
MKITIKDVAKKAGVSTTTVSMVLNNADFKISKKTRDKVLKSAEELNYVPNKIARSLVMQNTKIIALIVPDISNPFYPEIAKYVDIYASKRNYNVILINSNDIENLDDIEKNLLATNLIDGVLVVSINIAQYIKNNKRLRNLKVVYLDEFIGVSEDANTYIVSGDSEKGGYLAGKYLLELGHRNIGCVIGPRGTFNSNRRLSGFLNSFMEEGLYLKPENIVHGNYTYLGGYEAGMYLLEQGVTAAFCFNDLSAYGAIKAFREKNKNVPDDISVIGYDNLYMTEFIEPYLTTVDQNSMEIAKEATNLLIDQIENKKIKNKEILVAPKLIKRDTTIAL